MTIATRNGAIIVRDGKLAEDCACCGGWYCDAVSCYRCNLNVYPPACMPVWDSSCVSRFNCKTMVGVPCASTPVTITVAGLSQLGCSGVSMPEIAQLNGSYASQEVCSAAGLTTTLPPSPECGFNNEQAWFCGGTMIVTAGFSNKQAFPLAPCPDGFASLRITVGIALVYGSPPIDRHVRFGNTYHFPCVSIDSLPASGSMLKGKSAAIVMTSGQDCTQTATISFL